MRLYDYKEKPVEDSTSGELITKDTLCKLINEEISIPDEELSNMNDFFIDDHYEGEFFRHYSAEVGGVEWTADYHYDYRDIWLGLGYTSYEDFSLKPDEVESVENNSVTYVSTPVIPAVFAMAIAKDMIENKLRIKD